MSKLDQLPLNGRPQTLETQQSRHTSSSTTGKTVTKGTSSTRYQLNNLQPDTSYDVNIVAVSKLGFGLLNAAPLNVTTAAAGTLCASTHKCKRGGGGRDSLSRILCFVPVITVATVKWTGGRGGDLNMIIFDMCCSFILRFVLVGNWLLNSRLRLVAWGFACCKRYYS